MLDLESLEKKYEGVDEKKIVQMAKTNDLFAQEYLIRKYMRVVKSKTKTYFIVGGSREDIIQEGMIGIFKAINDYDEAKNDSFSPFVNMCVTRQIITAIKKATRQKHSPLNSSISLSEPLNGSLTPMTLIDTLWKKNDINPENMIISDENFKKIEEKMDTVLSKFELNVLLKHLQGDSYKTISKELGKKVKSVDNALQRVKKKLEKHLYS